MCSRRRGSPAVDRLEVVSDRGQVPALPPQVADDVDLQAVDVLVLVDQHVIELRLDLRSDDLVGREASPVQEQVVEVDDPERALSSRVRPEERGDVVPVLLAPRKGLGEHLGKRSLRVDRARVDIEQRALLRKPPPTLGVSVLLAHEVEHVGRVSGVKHAEACRQPERRRVPADEMMGDGMEGATEHAASAVRHRHQRPRALQHLARRATRERQQQDAFRRAPLGDEPCDPSAQRRGLTGSRPRQDQQRTARMTNRPPLVDIQLPKPLRIRGGLILGDGEHMFAG